MMCNRFEDCKKIGVMPERVYRGYPPCRNGGIIPRGVRIGQKCSFVAFPEVIDVEAANEFILAGKTIANKTRGI